MKQIFTLLLTATFLTGMVSCRKTLVGIGPDITENRTAAGFAAIDLRMYGDVYYTKDTAYKVSITGPKNIVEMINTTVANNSLVIQFTGASDRYDGDRIRINISAPAVNDFGLSSSGSIYCLSDLNPGALFLRVNGSGSISLRDVITNEIELINTASGNITALYGHAYDAAMKLTGSGQVNLSGILVDKAIVKNTASGRIHVKVADHLDANISGSGSVYFSGYPHVSSHISGTGRLIHL